jgi:hypothetical protein
MSRRIEALEEEATTTGAAGGSPRSTQSQKKITVKLASNLFLNLPEGLSELSYSRIGKTRMIACFMIDGSDRCTPPPSPPSECGHTIFLLVWWVGVPRRRVSGVARCAARGLTV